MYLDIYLDMYLDIYVEIYLDIYLNIYVEIYLDIKFAPPTRIRKLIGTLFLLFQMENLIIK